MKLKTVNYLIFSLLGAILVGGVRVGSAFGTELPTSGNLELNYLEPQYLTGAIYASDGSKKLLFNFKRIATLSGTSLRVQRDFTQPDGKRVAQEKVLYDGNRLVSYELEELQIGASGSAVIRREAENPARGSIAFKYTKGPGAHSNLRTEDLSKNTLIADMVGPFLVSHWDVLQRGGKVRCRYIVVPRRETVGFTFVKDSESIRQGRDVSIIRMEATSALVSMKVDPLFFAMEKAQPHHVLEYVGRTTPKQRVGDTWKDLDALTVFDWKPAR